MGLLERPSWNPENDKERDENENRPDGCISTDESDGLIPSEDSTREIECRNHSNHSQRIPLFNQHVSNTFREMRRRSIFVSGEETNVLMGRHFLGTFLKVLEHNHRYRCILELLQRLREESFPFPRRSIQRERDDLLRRLKSDAQVSPRVEDCFLILVQFV